LDALRITLPQSREESVLALAALIDAASECAASPGHTAQPFQPTSSAKAHLFQAWEKSVPAKVEHALARINPQVANTLGAVSIGDALGVVDSLKRGDLAFIDPPYSAVHYSRFYHVLESIAVGRVEAVGGVGRYPAREFRPRSAYSVKREAAGAMFTLLASIAKRGADAIVTFPNHECSNGLSGESIIAMAREHFDVTEVSVKSRLSTLGGTGPDSIQDEIRGARRDTSELIILLRS
jgi:adenine-specific DNA methylase